MLGKSLIVIFLIAICLTGTKSWGQGGGYPGFPGLSGGYGGYPVDYRGYPPVGYFGKAADALLDINGLTIYPDSKASVDLNRWRMPSSTEEKYFPKNMYKKNLAMVSVTRESGSEEVLTLDQFSSALNLEIMGKQKSQYTQEYMDLKNGYAVQCFREDGLKKEDQFIQCDTETKAFCTELLDIFNSNTENGSKLSKLIERCTDLETAIRERFQAENKKLDVENISKSFAKFKKDIAKPQFKDAPDTTVGLLKSQKMADVYRLLETCRHNPRVWALNYKTDDKDKSSQKGVPVGR